MDFVNSMKNVMLENYNEAYTENGAKGYATTGKALLDLNFAVASLRRCTEDYLINEFTKAFCEGPAMAITWLFYARDIREGLGERRIFRVCIANIFSNKQYQNAKYVVPVLNKIMELGRADDIFALTGITNAIDDMVVEFIKAQLAEDVMNMNNKKSVSLLAKWMPSEKASSSETVEKYRWIRNKLGMNAKAYRKMLSSLRKYIDVTEVKMCANSWTEIDYSKVPSKAGLNYKEAFMKHDEKRYTEFIDKAAKGEVKINSGALYPYEIVAKYKKDCGWYNLAHNIKYDESLEAMWKQLPDTVKGNGNTLVVSDGSGSMESCCAGSSVSALSVAQSLAIYFAERATGCYKNKYITFSEHPQFVDFTNCQTLKDKIAYAQGFDECANTNIEAVFDLILKTAIENKAKQEDMPKNILILSDMEFDGCAEDRYGNETDKELFKVIEEKYKEAGYRLPKLIFWNLNSRTGTIPMRENELGVALVSGFSANICNMVLTDELDPYKMLTDELMKDRYKAIYNLFSNK